jgi:hypothetical protein
MTSLIRRGAQAPLSGPGMVVTTSSTTCAPRRIGGT